MRTRRLEMNVDVGVHYLGVRAMMRSVDNFGEKPELKVVLGYMLGVLVLDGGVAEASAK